MDFLCVFDFSNSELIFLAASLAVAIGNEFDPSDVSKLSAFFTVLGDNLAIFLLDN